MAATYHIIRMRGHVDISRYPEFRGAFTSVPPGTPTLVDLRETSGVDSTFLSELLLLRRRHDAPVAAIVLPATHLARIFAIAGMDEKVDVYPSRAGALLALGIDSDSPDADVAFSDL